MPSATVRVAPASVSLAAGVRAPTALQANGIPTYLNLDPEAVTNDVEYEGDVLPDADTPAWTKDGTQSAAASGGELTLTDTHTSDYIRFRLTRSSLATGSPAWFGVRCKVSASSPYTGKQIGGGLLLEIRDGARYFTITVNTVGVFIWRTDQLDAFSGRKLTTSDYVVVELHKTPSEALVYVDGIVVARVNYTHLQAAVDKDFTIWTGTQSQGTGVVDYMHAKDATILPASSPVATLHYDGLVDDHIWNLAGFLPVENRFGEAGNIRYQHGAANATGATLNGTWRTAAEVATDGRKVGRFLRLDVQFNGDGSQDAGFSPIIEIAADVPSPLVDRRARRVGGGVAA